MSGALCSSLPCRLNSSTYTGMQAAQSSESRDWPGVCACPWGGATQPTERTTAANRATCLMERPSNSLQQQGSRESCSDDLPSRPHRWAPVAASRHTTPFLVSTYRTDAPSGPSRNPVISLVAWKRQSGMVSDRADLERSPVPVRARLTGWSQRARPRRVANRSTQPARDACAPPPSGSPDRTNAEPPCIGSSAILESFVACECSVAEETRTRGFASPALAGFALVDGAFLTELLIRHRQRRVK